MSIVSLGRAVRGAAALACWGSAAISGELSAGTVQRVEIIGTAFQITLEDGSVVSEDELTGAVLSVGDATVGSLLVRIDSFERDPNDPEGETVLYSFSVPDPATGGWRSLCEPDPDGLRRGFPLAGAWTPSGEHVRKEGVFSLTCTSG